MDRKEQLIERVREIMKRDDIVVQKTLPEYYTRAFEEDSPYKINVEIEHLCGWHPWGYYVVENVSYSSYVRQTPVGGTWTNDTRYTALVVFKRFSFIDEVTHELRIIYSELRKCFGFSVTDDDVECDRVIREALDL